MSYLVLARKHRPQAFDEVIGQEHITDLLKKTITSGRLPHAFLFCGPRGIGKTSCARILAKSLNCSKGPTLTPCGACPACQDITKGTSFDVLEIDGASNRGIDEIRTLRENVRFAPSYGKYKIYIVDEVHMLTMEAFNALLKTLEEPPEHVKFVFATTAPNKVPATIISRCQRYDFKRVPIKTIMGLLASIVKKEKLNIDQEALYAIAKAAQGSLRDALSILDQLGALSDQGIRSADVFSMLGLVETQLLFDLADALSQKDCGAGLTILDNILEKGKDIRQLSKDLVEHFRHLMVIKVGGPALGKLVDYPAATKDLLLEQTKKFTLKDILTAIDVFIAAQDEARVTESIRIPLELAFVKLTYQGEPQERSAVNPSAANRPAAKPVLKGNGPSPVDILRDRSGQVDISRSGSEVAKSAEKIVVTAPVSASGVSDAPANDMPAIASEEGMDTTSLNLERVRKNWDLLTHAVSREKMSLATYLQEGFPCEALGTTLTIGFPKRCAFHKETVEEKKNVEIVQRIFSEKLNLRVILRFALVEEEAPAPEAGDVKDVINTFGGKVVSRWHEG